VTGPGSARRWQGAAGWQPTGAPDAPPPGGRALMVINPNSSDAVTDGIAAALAPLQGWGVPIRCLTLAEGPAAIESEADAALCVPPLLALAADLEEAKKAVADCEPEIDDNVLRQYRYVKQQVKRPPVVVALEEGRCKGCHLKVSGDVESMARKGQELVRCDSCGRILYYDR